MVDIKYDNDNDNDDADDDDDNYDDDVESTIVKKLNVREHVKPGVIIVL